MGTSMLSLSVTRMGHLNCSCIELAGLYCEWGGPRGKGSFGRTLGVE